MANTALNVDLAGLIDHALLAVDATPAQVERCCQEADHYGFAAVCVYPWAVRQAAELLHRKPVQVATVIGFPTGATTTATKHFEVQEAVDNGATELDIVLNLGWLKAGQIDAVYQELASLVEAAGRPVKAILEMALLTEAEKQQAVALALEAGVAYLKTSTGWQGGATVADVQFLKRQARDRVGIKASGGIRTVAQAIALVEAGATRLGTSRGVDLVRQQRDLNQGA